MAKAPVSYAAAALYGFGIERQLDSEDPDFLESYERSVDAQLADEESAREDAGHADWLAGFIE